MKTITLRSNPAPKSPAINEKHIFKMHKNGPVAKGQTADRDGVGRFVAISNAIGSPMKIAQPGIWKDRVIEDACYSDGVTPM
jgi:hypothetical protein